jgi:acetone carboxylase gamma subunit
MIPSYDRATLEELLDGRLPWSEVHGIMSAFKDPDRFDKMLEIHQARVGWPDRILLPLGEQLYIVETADGRRIVKCACGRELGDYRSNWKLEALVRVRSSQAEIEELYPKMMAATAGWMELREFICPGCKTLLEVEAVPPGYPIVFDFQPDLEAFYAEWLGRPLPPARSGG